ncbi:MAG: 50S ribosomal protein L24 [Candidatus Colwellbacteria bacterium CG10_big_fil_rev_8_21_14_0_10_42_22]|uniref:Large ribosomal subunit protein uL24 n=1 Tax=Candidatus Colwellbacteria bacterium CG10_big_fil_rev_8_21_14_0_10_42_22 TaxID=1974540 RepID=A0A2H0VFG8_9BACT|nr:MAG: 50S ribosomal protein L24 [Candidatus Colwellbacteria bacterium CG10_big_fil_rev_8_21_14_0_10_42_22]
MKIKKGDKVIVLKGKDSGKSGKVLRIMPEDSRLVIEGLNLLKKTVRAKKGGEKGQVIDTPSPINLANVQLICSSCNKATRVGYRIKGSKKERYCKKCEAKN